MNFKRTNRTLKRNLILLVCAEFLGIYSVAMVPVIIWLDPTQLKWQYLVSFGIVALIIKFVFGSLFHSVFPEKRPYQQYHLTPFTSWFLSWKQKEPVSFPSEHVFVLASFASISFFFLSSQSTIYFLILALLVGIGRVWLGFHYVRDVVAGIILGILLGYFIFLLPWYFLIFPLLT
ncbi:MAG TPA: phosphatase PAP2 family protein [Patescibacteria group bacterium]|nr:phosphatase PAP2 family protein [Patescibacteria group bacterium]